MSNFPAQALPQPSLSIADLQRILDQLGAGRADGRGPLSRFDALYQRIRTREHHLYNTREANPLFGPPWEDAQPWQSDIARRTWARLRSRLTEHPFRIHVEPPGDAPEQRRAANDLRARAGARPRARPGARRLQPPERPRLRAGLPLLRRAALAARRRPAAALPASWRRGIDRQRARARPSRQGAGRLSLGDRGRAARSVCLHRRPRRPERPRPRGRRA